MVFVLDAHQKPLMPCPEKRARPLRERGGAVVHRPFPLATGMRSRTAHASAAAFQDLRLKVDPGSKTTGLAIVLSGQIGAEPSRFGEFVHQPHIKRRLQARMHGRRGRRCRPARFAPRRRPQGWLPPSLIARVDPTLRAVTKISRLAPITALSMERVGIDSQELDNPEMTGVEYQQGTLLGYEVREYLLAKWGHPCAYGAAIDVPVEIDPMTAKSRGVPTESNLTTTCRLGNKSKDARAWDQPGIPPSSRNGRDGKPTGSTAFSNNATGSQRYDRWKTPGRTTTQRIARNTCPRSTTTMPCGSGKAPRNGLPIVQAGLAKERGINKCTARTSAASRPGIDRAARCLAVCKRATSSQPTCSAANMPVYGKAGYPPARRVPSISRRAASAWPKALPIDMVGFFNVRMGGHVKTNRSRPADDGAFLPRPNG